MPRRQLVSLTCPRAGQAVGFVNLPSCRAGTYFRYTTKVGKGVPKGEENRSERFSEGNLLPFLLWNPSSFDRSRFASVAEAPGAYRNDISAWFPRRAAPAGKSVVRARGAYVFKCVKVIHAALAV